MDATRAITVNLSGDLLKQPPTEITVSLGNAAGELKFEPNYLEFQASQRYNPHLTNPSLVKHYFRILGVKILLMEFGHKKSKPGM